MGLSGKGDVGETINQTARSEFIVETRVRRVKQQQCVGGKGVWGQGTGMPCEGWQKLLHRNVHNYITETFSGSEEGSYLRLIDLCIT